MLDSIISFVNQTWRKLIPFTIIDEYERGIILRLGKYKKTLKPGIHWKIPLMDRIISDEVVSTTLPLEAQSLCTLDNKNVTVKAIVKYKIVNIKDYLLKVYDVVDAIQDVSQGVVRKCISSLNYEEINDLDLEYDMVYEVNEKVSIWGLEIETITITDLVQTKMYRIFGEGTIIE